VILTGPFADDDGCHLQGRTSNLKKHWTLRGW